MRSGAELPIAGIAGDQQAALFGQGCWSPGQGKNTYGTGAFLLMHTGEERARSESGLLTTAACGPRGERAFALEGAIFIAGAAVQWLRDALGAIAEAAETEALARGLDSNDGVYLVPAFTGLGAPHWEPRARGTIVGLTRGTGTAHLARAALEAMAYSTCDVAAAMERDAGTPLHELAGGRRGFRQRLADAVPGRRARRPGPPPRDGGDHRVRRSGPGRSGARLLVHPGGVPGCP
jgi:glycerol kinase